jgi:hypothetical protein
VLRFSAEIVRTTFRMLRKCGRAECECVVYWIGPAGEDVADGLEHPIHKRSPFGYEVDDTWLTELWKRLAVSQRSIKVQIHTHPGQAFHSPTDDKWPIVAQAGFLSMVIPDFATGEPCLDRAWIGILQGDGTWRRLLSPADALVLE